MRPGNVTVQRLAVGGHEDSDHQRCANGRVTPPGGARFRGHGHDLATLAKYGQGAVAPLEAKGSGQPADWRSLRSQ
jgi:hypothetical protein